MRLPFAKASRDLVVLKTKHNHNHVRTQCKQLSMRPIVTFYDPKLVIKASHMICKRNDPRGTSTYGYSLEAEGISYFLLSYGHFSEKIQMKEGFNKTRIYF